MEEPVKKNRRGLKKFFHYYLLALFLVILANIIFIIKSADKPVINYLKFSNEKDETAPDCNNLIKTGEIIDGESMEPMLQNGEEVVLINNYYQCDNEPKIGDLVAYHHKGNENLLIKIVKADSKSFLEIKNGRLKIDGEVMKNSAGEEYIFDQEEIAILNFYIHSGYLSPDYYFIFGDNTKVSTDSRVFGAVKREELLGKFEINNNF